MLTALVFDWGDTVMRDFDLPGPMSGWEKVAWVPGAQTLLEAVCKQYCCIIATSASHSDVPEMKKALARVNAERYFSRFYSKHELGFSKPDPAFFAAVLNHSGFKPSEAMIIGNLYDKDIVGAKAGGMRTALLNEAGIEGDYPMADYVVKNLDELIQILMP